MTEPNKQKRNFVINQSKLQTMRHDPSLSIDDVISKLMQTPQAPEFTRQEKKEHITAACNFPVNFEIQAHRAPQCRIPDTETQNQSSIHTISNLVSRDHFSVSNRDQRSFSEFEDLSIPFHGSDVHANLPGVDDTENDFGDFACARVAGNLSFVQRPSDEYSNFKGLLSASPADSNLFSFEPTQPPVLPLDTKTSDAVWGTCLNNKSDASFSLEFGEVNSDLISELSVKLTEDVSGACSLPGNTVFDFNITVKKDQEQNQKPPRNQPLEPHCSTDEISSFDDSFQEFQGFSAQVDKMSEPTFESPDQLRCLNECLLMLKDSDRILSVITNTEDINAFIDAPRGNDFIFELIQIYGISQRIRISTAIKRKHDVTLDSVLNQIEEIWTNLSRFIKYDRHKNALACNLVIDGVSQHQIDLSRDPTSENRLCGVCVLPVSKIDNAYFALAGNVYHHSCANLWVNRVQLALPAFCRN